MGRVNRMALARQAPGSPGKRKGSKKDRSALRASIEIVPDVRLTGAANPRVVCWQPGGARGVYGVHGADPGAGAARRVVVVVVGGGGSSKSALGAVGQLCDEARLLDP